MQGKMLYFGNLIMKKVEFSQFRGIIMYSYKKNCNKKKFQEFNCQKMMKKERVVPIFDSSKKKKKH